MALAAGLLAGANFTAVAQTAATTATAKPADTKTADNCLPGPKGAAPAGSHWRYHLDRATKSKCWYLGEAKGNAAVKTATAQQQQAAPAPAPETTAADATNANPPQVQAQPQPQAQQPQPPMSRSVANARAEWPSPQTAAAPAAPADTDQAVPAPDPGATAAPADANGQSSAVNARWFDASSMAGSNGTRHAATAQPSTVAQADTPPQQANTAAPAAAAAAAEVPAEKPSSSTQMLLIVMVGALALAGLVSALVVKLTRRRTASYDMDDEQRAPWDSIYLEQTPPMSLNRARQLSLSDLPPRRAQPPVPRREAARSNTPDETEADSRQIAAMLQRLARSAAN
ncbi:hypothetical protein IC762_15955 [Bradyrhizobium genosp. L]|uniref:hypothetical protein n=1 Tax=Bradyrhizobium genosp. L TaxID=83637 RepID=UPI0018A32DCC|nr:hypothetical protein [Bradyrhizobium genosp. L]QPF87690.1 hypothetical protein IC762_15955 [Bradyrhizobium genosp. L]